LASPSIGPFKHGAPVKRCRRNLRLRAGQRRLGQAGLRTPLDCYRRRSGRCSYRPPRKSAFSSRSCSSICAEPARRRPDLPVLLGTLPFERTVPSFAIHHSPLVCAPYCVFERLCFEHQALQAVSIRRSDPAASAVVMIMVKNRTVSATQQPGSTFV
jgi:hypothetical protein